MSDESEKLKCFFWYSRYHIHNSKATDYKSQPFSQTPKVNSKPQQTANPYPLLLKKTKKQQNHVFHHL